MKPKVPRRPRGIRDDLVAVFGYGLRVEAYAGLLTGTYPGPSG